MEWSAVIALAAAGLVMLHGRTLGSGFARLPGDLGDTRFILLILEHGFRHLRGDAFDRQLWSPAWAFFPHANVLAYSENLIGDQLLYAPLRFLGLEPVRALGAWIVLCSLLNFSAAVLLGRTLGLSRLGAGAAAALFSFGMPRSQQLNHAQLLPQFWTPLCLFSMVAAWRAWQKSRRRGARWWAAACAGCAVGQVAAGVYLGDFLLLGLVALSVLIALELRRDASRRSQLLRFLRATGVAWLSSAAVGAALLFPIARAYAQAHRELGGRQLGEVMGLLPHFESYLLPHPGSVFYRWLAPLGARLPLAHEHTMFAGLAPLCALGWLAMALWRRRTLPVAGWVAGAALGVWVFTCLATLRVGSFHGVAVSLWWFLRPLPGFDALRALTRVAVFQLLPAGLALGIGVTALQGGVRRWRLALAWLLAAAPLLENWSDCTANVSRDEVVARARTVAERIPDDCGVFFWRGQNGTDPEYVIQLDAMSASLELGRPTLNGYSGNVPPGWPFRDPRAANPATLRGWLEREGKPDAALCLPK